jgi:RNA-directed DNA polymerase
VNNVFKGLKLTELMEGSQQNVDGAGQLRLFKKRRKDMSAPERVSALQGKLYQKAKQERGFKFYVLYDKVFLAYVLECAWRSVKSNGGAPGIDGVTIEDVERRGVGEFLLGLGEDLRKQTYRAQGVRRVMIAKANGGERPLGIPTVRDRVAQAACKLILEPIFEADFEDGSYGYRPNRGAKDAMAAIKGHLQAGRTEVLEADLSRYFDTIPHAKLMKALQTRVTDPRVLRLVEQWLKAPVHADGKYTGGRGSKAGTPQGGVISPLLANIYLHLLDRIVANPQSVFGRMGIKIVRYADDFVLMGRRILDEPREKLKSLLGRMGLSLNERKTKLVDATRESFGFLGFTVRYALDLHGRNTRYWDIHPSDKSGQRIRDKVSHYLHTHGHSKAVEVAQGLNKIIKGWMNYFDIKGVSYPKMGFRRLRDHLYERLNRYYNRKSQRKCRLYGQRAFDALVTKYGLIDPSKPRPSHARP